MHKRKAEARRWFQQACYDLKAARWSARGGFYDTACFLAQQSGEKALKSLMYYAGSRKQALMTHSLVDMIQHAPPDARGVQSLIEDARSLDLHYIPSRYPNGLPSGYPHQFYGSETADKAITAAQKILGFVADYFAAREEDEITQGDT